MFYQKYMIHLKGGIQVEVEEPYDLPWEKSLFTMYEKTRTMKNNKFFSVSLLTGWRYFYAAFNVSS